MICECNTEMVTISDSSTYVAYLSPPGHDHDDNWQVVRYRCPNCGKQTELRKENKCPAVDCDWKSSIKPGAAL